MIRPLENMVSQRSEGLAKLLIVCQVALTALVFCLCSAVTFRFLSSATPELLGYYPSYLAVVLVGLFLEGALRDKTEMRVRLLGKNPLTVHRIAFRQTLFVCGALFAYLAATKDVAISRTFVAVLGLALYVTYVASSLYVPRLLARHIFRGVHEERTLLIGSLAKLPQLMGWLEAKSALGFRTLGVLSEDGETGKSYCGICRLGNLQELEQVVRGNRPTQLLLLQLPDERAAHRGLVALAERYGLRLLILNTLEETLQHPVVHFEDDGCHLIGLRTEPLENPLNRVLKRTLDLTVAVPVCVFMLPLLAIIVWLFQRWQSPGPLFFYQERAGLQNRRFQLVKFRTMHSQPHDHARQATQGDTRIFPAGRLLRRWSLDEVPQFSNVLMGDMSVVGPRPHLIEHNDQFAQQLSNYHIRTFVKPGITGLAQVRGFRGEVKSNADLCNRLRSDLFYLETWTLWTDLLLMVRTAWQMLIPPKSAY